MIERRRHWLCLGTLVLGVMVLQAGCYRAVGTRCDEVSAEGIESVRIDTQNATVTLNTDPDAQTIYVMGEFQLVAMSKREARLRLDEVRLEVVRDGAEAVVEMDVPGLVEQADLTVWMPVGLPVAVETSNGRVSVDGFTEDLTVSTTNGDVDVTEGAGVLFVETTNGAISVLGVEGALLAQTTNGDIEVHDLVGDVAVQTTNADIALDVSATAYCRASSTNGDIDLRLDADAAGTLVAQTTNGEVEVEGFSFQGAVTADEVSGTFGGGGFLDVDLQTTNADITVRGDRADDPCDDPCE